MGLEVIHTYHTAEGKGQARQGPDMFAVWENCRGARTAKSAV